MSVQINSDRDRAVPYLLLHGNMVRSLLKQRTSSVMVEIDFVLPILSKTIQALNGVQIRFGHAEHRFLKSLFSVSATAVSALDGSYSPRKPHLQTGVGNSSAYWSD